MRKFIVKLLVVLYSSVFIFNAMYSTTYAAEAGVSKQGAIQGLYVAYFNRPADSGAGLDSWANLVSSGILPPGILTVPEYTESYAKNNYWENVNNIYQNLFGRSLDNAGLDFWVKALSSGTNPLTTITQGFLTSESADGPTPDTGEETKDATDAFIDALGRGTQDTVGYSGTGNTLVSNGEPASDATTSESADSPTPDTGEETKDAIDAFIDALGRGTQDTVGYSGTGNTLVSNGEPASDATTSESADGPTPDTGEETKDATDALTVSDGGAAVGTFSDVPVDDPSFEAIEAFAKAGIISGIGDGLFGFDKELTRQQLAVIFVKILGIDVTGMGKDLKFSDVESISDYARDAVAAAVALGLFQGYPDGTFKPKGPVTDKNLDTLMARFNKTIDQVEELFEELLEELGVKPPSSPEPVNPTPVNPEPVNPTPVNPEPVNPTPVNPEPVNPTPVNPEPVNPTPVNPEPVNPTPVNPEPVNPTPVNPEPVNPTPVNPEPVNPTPVNPEPVNPTPVNPEPVNPTPVNPEPVNPNPNPNNPDQNPNPDPGPNNPNPNNPNNPNQ